MPSRLKHLAAFFLLALARQLHTQTAVDQLARPHGIPAGQSPALLKSLLRIPGHPIAFICVRAFLDGNHFADNQTIVVDHGRIVAIGPTDSTTIPVNAQIIEGGGKTLVPGLWDSHMHFGDDSNGPFLLALGITSARDFSYDNLLSIAGSRRRATGLSPNLYPSVLIDTKPNPASTGISAASLQEAIAAVDKANVGGLIAIRFSGTCDQADGACDPPRAIPAVKARSIRLRTRGRTHRLRHENRRSRAMAAGHVKITPIYFISMEAIFDSLVPSSTGGDRFARAGRDLKDVDLNADPLKSLVVIMAARHIVSDPTLVAAESLFVSEDDGLSPAYAPYHGILPAASDRGFRETGFTLPNDHTRAGYSASFAKLCQLVELMHAAGVPIVAGTDGSGLELVRELELYVTAGFTPSEALAAATIVPAHIVGADKTTGSISLGKVADLVLVEGDPSRNIGDLRNTRIVMLNGNLLDTEALRDASGFSGRPKAQ